MAGRVSRQNILLGRETLIAGLLLFFAVAFNLYHLYPEVAIKVPSLNDGVLHRLALEQSARALAGGQSPLDPWLAPIALGYPLFHYYQHLPYIGPAALHLLSGEMFSLTGLFHWTRYLLLSLFPLSIYWSVRRFGFARLAAAWGGLLASLPVTNGLYGFDFASYTWSGYGLYTQLWGMFLLPPALAQSYVVLKTGRGYPAAVLLLAVTLLSHLLLGYMALISIVCLIFLPLLGGRAEGGLGHALWQRGKRLLLLLLCVALVTAYFWLPFLLDSPYMNRSVWEEPGKIDAYGFEWTLSALRKGELFDFGRLPSLTFLAGVGLFLCLWRWREERYRIPVMLSILWLLLYFGRPTWGGLLDLLPMSRDLHLHRLIAGVHLGGIYLMGLGLTLPWRWALSRAGKRYLLMTATLTALLLYPVYQERGAYLRENTRLMGESRNAFAAEEAEITALMTTLQQLPPGRVYAGRAGNWGKEYKVGAVPVYALLNEAGLDMVGYLYHALSLNADIQVLFDENRPEHYNLFNIRYVVAPAEHPFLDFVRPVAEFGRHRLYQVETSGYFDLAGSEAAFTGAKVDFYPAVSHWLASDLPRIKQHPTLLFGPNTSDAQPTFTLPQAAEVIPLTSFPLGLSRGRIISETVEGSVYLAEVELERKSVLMLKATYHPNWRAYVDGIEAGTVMLMPSYVGLNVSPGAHRIRLEYRPRPLRGYLLGLALLALLLIALAEQRRETLARWLRLNRSKVRGISTPGSEHPLRN